MVKRLPPINSNQRIVDDNGRPLSAFVLLINQLIGLGGGGGGLVPLVPDPSGTFGDATHVPEITVNEYGQITGVTLVPITGGGGGADFLTWSVDSTGTGVPQVVTIPAGQTVESVLVFVNGLRWETHEYSILGTSLTLTTNSAGDEIEIVGSLADFTPWVVDAVGTGVSQNITLPTSGLNVQQVLVFSNGIRWFDNEYTITGDQLTMTSNSAGDSIEIIGPLKPASGGGGGGGLDLPVTIVQVAPGSHGNNAAANVAFADPTTAGNTILVIVGVYGNASPTTLPPGFVQVSTISADNQKVDVWAYTSQGEQTYQFQYNDHFFTVGYEMGPIKWATLTWNDHIGTSPWAALANAELVGGQRFVVGVCEDQETWAFTTPGITTDYVANAETNHTGIVGRLGSTVDGFIAGTRTGTEIRSIVAFVEIGGSPPFVPPPLPPTGVFPAAAALGAHRYWNIKMGRDNGGENLVLLTELYFMKAGVPLTTGANYFCDGSLTGGPLTQLTNGTTGDYCYNSAGTSWNIWCDLGAGVTDTPDQIRMASRVGGFEYQSPNFFTLQWSDDGVTWHDARKYYGMEWFDAHSGYTTYDVNFWGVRTRWDAVDQNPGSAVMTVGEMYHINGAARINRNITASEADYGSAMGTHQTNALGGDANGGPTKAFDFDTTSYCGNMPAGFADYIEQRYAAKPTITSIGFMSRNDGALYVQTPIGFKLDLTCDGITYCAPTHYAVAAPTAAAQLNSVAVAIA